MSDPDLPRFRVSAEATTLTYVFCRAAAQRALRHAQENERGSFYFFMMAGVFAAFTVEAFLNHIGGMHLHSWAEIERRLGPREKLRLLAEVRGWSIDLGRRPFQTLRDVFRLRDALAHGRTATATAEFTVEGEAPDYVEPPVPEWRQLCSSSSCARLVEDAEAVVRDLWRQSDGTGDPFASSGHGSHEVGLVP